MADPWDLFDSLLLNQPNFKGRVAVISAFFDESETADKSVFVVAGVLFDRDGLETFTREWQRRTASLPGPYRTSHCATGRGAFSQAPWDKEACNQFMRDTAALIRDTYKAATVTTIQPETVATIWREHPKTREIIPGPYALGVLHSLHNVSGWAERTGYDGQIEYWFERGAPGEPEARAMLARIDQNDELRARFRIGNQYFADKQGAAALAAGDYLGWQRQRHLVEKVDTPYREDFEILRSAKKGPIYSSHLTPNDVNLYGLLTRFYDLLGSSEQPS